MGLLWANKREMDVDSQGEALKQAVACLSLWFMNKFKSRVPSKCTALGDPGL